jgi:hypothetical protein
VLGLFMYCSSVFHHYSGNISDQFIDPFYFSTSLRDGPTEPDRMNSVYQTLIARNTILLTQKPSWGPYFPPLAMDFSPLAPDEPSRRIMASWPERARGVDREIQRRNATDPWRRRHPFTAFLSGNISASTSY